MEETVKKPQYIIRKNKKRNEDTEKRLKEKERKKKRKHKELSTLKSQYSGMSEDTFSTDICV